MVLSTPSDASVRTPRFDVVLQVTGNHAHAVGYGIVNSLKRLGILGRVFQPRAEWGQPEPLDDGGLFDYLTAPENEFLLFLGFDWHSQPLHTSMRWRHRIRTSPCVKIGYLHETLRNGSENEQRNKLNAVMSCYSLLDIIWHASPHEADYLEAAIEHSRPVFVSNFAVDTGFFSCHRATSSRPGFAFFRGKLHPFTDPSQYQERRELIEHLSELGLVDVKVYDPAGFSDAQLVDEYNSYRICIDPPSVFAGPTTRVFEAIACGCMVFSHARNFNHVDLRNLSPLLRTFTSKEDLSLQLLQLRNDHAAVLDEKRQSEIQETISLDVQLTTLISEWHSVLPRLSLSAPIVRIYDHPYHAITKSQKFVFDHYSDLNIVLVTCDTKERAPIVYDSPTFNRGCYMELAWQTIHIYPHFNHIERRKRVLFPMFDGSNHWPDEAFPSYASYVCFSRTLHMRLQRLNRESNYVRYFPDSGLERSTIDLSIERTRVRRAEGNLKAYYWQRTSEISIECAIKICKQLGCNELIVNVHNDPGQTKIVKVNDGVVNGVSVRTHGWFDRRADALAQIDYCDIYIAPRSCEGIGMGFLEAMSRGLCVVAFDAPTMNEYIVDGVNGLLFRDLKNPELKGDVDLVRIRRQVAEEAESMASMWKTHLEWLLNQYHPYKYSAPLKWLRDKGVRFLKPFYFTIPIDSSIS